MLLNSQNLVQVLSICTKEHWLRILPSYNTFDLTPSSKHTGYKRTQCSLDYYATGVLKLWSNILLTFCDKCTTPKSFLSYHTISLFKHIITAILVQKLLGTSKFMYTRHMDTEHQLLYLLQIRLSLNKVVTSSPFTMSMLQEQ